MIRERVLNGTNTHSTTSASIIQPEQKLLLFSFFPLLMKILRWVGVRFKLNNACKILGRSIFLNFRLLPNVLILFAQNYTQIRMLNLYYEYIHTTLCLLDTNMTDGGECSQLKPLINKGCKIITWLARISYGIPLSSA